MTEIIGHRGASYDAPENTMPAVELAIEQGADGVEVDVFATSDGRIVAIHDEDTERVAGTRLEVEGSTLEELQQLDVGSWKGEEWAGTRIPTLDDVLAAIPEGRKLLVEVKCGEEALPTLQKTIGDSGKSEQVSLIGFSYPLIERAKLIMPNLPCYWIYGFSARERLRWGNPSLNGLIRRARKAGLDGLDLEGYASFDQRLVERLADEGMDLYVWTVNDVDRARELVDMGVRGITTDRPGFLRRGLAGDDR